MTTKQVWLITGAGRGLGVDIARSALAAGHAVVATGRDPQKVDVAIGRHDNLLAVKLDVTHPEDAQAAIQTTVRKCGRIDVLVNNAGDFYAGFFEELSPEQVRRQIETLLFGPMNVTRAALPVMRKQRSGLLITISSTAGIAGQLFCTAYAAAKFGLEGWIESLTPEVAPFGIRTMLIEPGFFRTGLLSAGSTTYAKPSLDDYASNTTETVAAWSSMDGKQGGDPPNSPRQSCNSPGSRNLRLGSLPAPTRCRPSKLKQKRCSPRRMPTVTFPALSPATTSNHSRHKAGRNRIASDIHDGTFMHLRHPAQRLGAPKAMHFRPRLPQYPSTGWPPEPDPDHPSLGRVDQMTLWARRTAAARTAT